MYLVDQDFKEQELSDVPKTMNFLRGVGESLELALSVVCMQQLNHNALVQSSEAELLFLTCSFAIWECHHTPYTMGDGKTLANQR